jgi:hypothetical protein
MGRMHTPGKGMSSSALPYKRSPPSWLKITPTEVRACSTLATPVFLPVAPGDRIAIRQRRECLRGLARTGPV